MTGIQLTPDPSNLPVHRVAPLPSTDVGYSGPTGSDDAGGGITVGRVLAALSRGKWLILAMAAAGLAGGVVATRFVVPLFEVDATIWIESPNSTRNGPVQGEELVRGDAWTELATKYAVVDPVVLERKLYLSGARGPDSSYFRGFDVSEAVKDGPFAYKVDPASRTYELAYDNHLFERGNIGDSVGLRWGLKWVPRPPANLAKPKTVKFSVVQPRDASNALIKKVKINLAKNNFLLFKLSDASSGHAATTLNTLIRRFVDEAGRQKKERLTQMRQALDQQLADQEARLHEAERELEQFRVNTVTLPKEDVAVAPGLQMTQSTAYGDYFQLRKTIDELKRDRRQIKDAMDRVRSGEATIDAFQTIGAVRAAPALIQVLGEIAKTEAELRAARTRYTDENKIVKDLLETLNTLKTLTLSNYASALEKQLALQESDLEGRMNSSARELHDIPTRSIKEAQLKRQVEQADMLFRTLDRSRQEARMAEASAVPEVRILDTAVAASTPNKNNAPSLIAVGLLLGLVCGIGLALLLDIVDRRLRYPDQVSHALGLSIMGVVPAIARTEGGQRTPEEMAQVMEAFRTLRMNLAHSFPTDAPLTLTISSPAPGDGKSLIASNLVLSFAEAGFSTVLIDGDTRRGAQHRTFNVDSKPGLLDYLAGDANIGAIIRPTFHPRLSLVPCGTRNRQGPELLGSSKMMDLMNHLKSRYEVVIVDSPPLGAGIDPFVLGIASGAMIVVLRVGETDKALTKAKLENLQRLPIRVLGAVLNDVEPGRGAYRYYSYSYGYAAEDEEQAPAAQLQDASSTAEKS